MILLLLLLAAAAFFHAPFYFSSDTSVRAFASPHIFRGTRVRAVRRFATNPSKESCLSVPYHYCCNNITTKPSVVVQQWVSPCFVSLWCCILKLNIYRNTRITPPYHTCATGSTCYIYERVASRQYFYHHLISAGQYFNHDIIIRKVPKIIRSTNWWSTLPEESLLHEIRVYVL